MVLVPTPGLSYLSLQLHLSCGPHVAPEKPDLVSARPLSIHGSLWDPEARDLSQADAFGSHVVADGVSLGRPALWSELGPLAACKSVSDCTPLAPLGQDTVMGADTHMEQSGSVLGVPVLRERRAPSWEAAPTFWYPLGPSLIPSCPESPPFLL